MREKKCCLPNERGNKNSGNGQTHSVMCHDRGMILCQINAAAQPENTFNASHNTGKQWFRDGG